MKWNRHVTELARTANTIFEGMAVTFSHMFREPVTIQYPDRTERPVSEMLPDGFRGLLEVNLNICTSCRRCQRACPVECIAIETEKNPETKKMMLTRFDIDISKCMFCGLCVVACDEGSTGALRHTKEFEAAAGTIDALYFRFVDPEHPVPVYRAPKDKSEIPYGPVGPFAREARERALRDNPELFERKRREAEAKSVSSSQEA